MVEGTEGPFVTILDSWKDGSTDGHLSKSSMWTFDAFSLMIKCCRAFGHVVVGRIIDV